jgi:hypothetical protein
MLVPASGLWPVAGFRSDFALPLGATAVKKILTCGEQAAAYVGVSPSLFDMLIKDGRMPGPSASMRDWFGIG